MVACSIGFTRIISGGRAEVVMLGSRRFQDGFELRSGNHFPFQQEPGSLLQYGSPSFQQSPYPSVLLVHDPPYLAVYFAGGLFGIIAFFRSDRKLKKLRLSLPFQCDGAEFLAHSVGL